MFLETFCVNHFCEFDDQINFCSKQFRIDSKTLMVRLINNGFSIAAAAQWCTVARERVKCF